MNFIVLIGKILLLNPVATSLAQVFPLIITIVYRNGDGITCVFKSAGLYPDLELQIPNG